MRTEHLAGLVSPLTGQAMHLTAIESREDGEVKLGKLIDGSGKHEVPIRNFIPRFVEGTSYADSFGTQWNRYRAVQIDGENKLKLSAERFYRWTGWTQTELRGRRILEAGCGAGRFTQIMLDAGANVYSFDLSSAVDACWHTNGPDPNLCLIQADLRQLPFPAEFFDRIFCYGVLQHTPDPRKAFMALIPLLRRGGKISIDCYVKSYRLGRWTSKYLWRPITTRLSPQTLFKIVEWYIPKWLPIDTKLSRIPGIGRWLVGIVPCWNYTDLLPLDRNEVLPWAILDTFDALAPRYDKPQTPDAVASWFSDAGLTQIRVERGSNGIVGNAIKP